MPYAGLLDTPTTLTLSAVLTVSYTGRDVLLWNALTDLEQHSLMIV